MDRTYNNIQSNPLYFLHSCIAKFRDFKYRQVGASLKLPTSNYVSNSPLGFQTSTFQVFTAHRAGPSPLLAGEPAPLEPTPRPRCLYAGRRPGSNTDSSWTYPGKLGDSPVSTPFQRSRHLIDSSLSLAFLLHT